MKHDKMNWVIWSAPLPRPYTTHFWEWNEELRQDLHLWVDSAAKLLILPKTKSDQSRVASRLVVHIRGDGELLSDAHCHANDGGTGSLISTPNTVRPSVGPCTLLQLHYHFITLSLSQLCSSQTPPQLFSNSFFCLWTATAPFVSTSANVFQQRSENTSAIFTFWIWHWPIFIFIF